MTRPDALRALYNKISVLDFDNKGEPWDELTEDQRGAATAAIEELLPPLIDQPSGLPFKIVGTEAARELACFFQEAALQSPACHEVSDDDIDQHAQDLIDVVAHRDHLDKQVTGLQHDLTRFTNRARDAEWMLAGMAARIGGEPIGSCSFEEGRDETKLWRSGWEQVNSALAEAAKRTPVVITVVRRAGDFQARLDERRWEAGASEEGAIAKLIISRGSEIGIQVAFTRGGEDS